MLSIASSLFLLGAVRNSKWGIETQAAIASYVQEWLKHGKFRNERKVKKNNVLQEGSLEWQ